MQALSHEKRLKGERYIFADRQINRTTLEDRDYTWAGGLEQYQEKYFYKDNYDRYYGGHQHRLGHYFRHHYITMCFINQHPLLNLKEKRSSADLIRAQLSTYEQVLLLLNSVSILGRTWELEDKLRPSVQIPVNEQLITKFELIRNIYSDDITIGLKASIFYPAINYETFEVADVNLRRKKLKKW